ncbi:Rv2231c family pyridoxal phosphate-dependent protein CobC [Gordonia sp. VNK21]|uniref:Rv2231c family pyridoxal phosphate-dependent protein CobC n=1 Tax=Gordonia sp. VNK21 TaxID=3382483 RepID=UPI0038D43647
MANRGVRAATRAGQADPDAAALRSPDRHGDADAESGLVDFAVNVQPGPPGFLRRALTDRIGSLAGYPAEADEQRARAAIADLHGRSPDEVLLLAGAAEGFELLARLAPRRAVLLEPTFTEPARVLGAAGVELVRVQLRAPWRLDGAAARVTKALEAPSAAGPGPDLVIIGNPTNPTSVLHPREQVAALAGPGRILVVDEAFADLTLGGAHAGAAAGEPESLAGERAADLIVIRSITKTFGLAGLRAGYLLAAPELIARLETGRRHWPLGTLALTALAEAAGADGQRYVAQTAAQIAEDREYLVAALAAIGVPACAPPQAPFVLIEVPDGLAVKAALRAHGFGVRSCANFTGLSDDHLRLAVRPRPAVDELVTALRAILPTGQDGGMTGKTSR